MAGKSKHDIPRNLVEIRPDSHTLVYVDNVVGDVADTAEERQRDVVEWFGFSDYRA